MLQYDNCPHCFEPKGGQMICPHCGYDITKTKQYAGVLPTFTILKGRYLLGRVLGKGGFGVTYIAKDMMNNRTCAIKEYLPSEYSSRSGNTKNIVPHADSKAQYVFKHGREKFVDEARTLVELRNNPIVVDIWDFFQENNTAYLVMECLDGQDLRQKARANGGQLDADYVKTVFVTVASSLMEIHRKSILHRDLSPENIIATKDGAIKLIDFGAARNFVSTQNAGMSILLKPGFAPPEQYEKKGAHGPWSDVYALCATFYNLVSGKPLIDALFRYRGQEQPSLISMGCNVTKKTSDVIQKGMELDYRKRYQDFAQLLNDIDIDAPVRPKPPVLPKSTTSDDKRFVGMKRAYIASVVGNSMYNKTSIPVGDILKVGRSPQSCQYTIAGDTNISRIHCYVKFDGKNLSVTDCSSNGTFYADGRRLIKNQESIVAPGTRFYLATSNRMMIVGLE